MSSAENSAQLNILVVDDERLIRWSLRRAFTAAGHESVEAGTAAEAVQCLASTRRPFDAVLLDFRLPDRQDLSLLAEVKQTSPASAVFLMSAFAEPQMRAEALGMGALAVIDKPFRIGAVVAMIEARFRRTQ